jgi:hypothetical protein
MQEIVDFIQRAGAIGALIYILFMIKSGDIRTKQEVDGLHTQLIENNKTHELAITSLKEQHVEALRIMREEYANRIQVQEAKETYLRDALLQALSGIQRGVDVTERAVAIAERQS